MLDNDKELNQYNGVEPEHVRLISKLKEHHHTKKSECPDPQDP